MKAQGWKVELGGGGWFVQTNAPTRSLSFLPTRSSLLRKVFLSRPGWPRICGSAEACTTVPTLAFNIPKRHRRAGIVDRCLWPLFCYWSAVCETICKGKHWSTQVVRFPGSNSIMIRGVFLFFCFFKPQVPGLQTNPINIFGGRSLASYLKTKEHSQGISY